MQTIITAFIIYILFFLTGKPLKLLSCMRLGLLEKRHKMATSMFSKKRFLQSPGNGSSHIQSKMALKSNKF